VSYFHTVRPNIMCSLSSFVLLTSYQYNVESPGGWLGESGQNSWPNVW